MPPRADTETRHWDRNKGGPTVPEAQASSRGPARDGINCDIFYLDITKAALYVTSS